MFLSGRRLAAGGGGISQTRRLAAILAGDVAVYRRLQLCLADNVPRGTAGKEFSEGPTAYEQVARGEARGRLVLAP